MASERNLEINHQLYFDGRSQSVAVRQMLRDRGISYTIIERPVAKDWEDTRCPTLQVGSEWVEGFKWISLYLEQFPALIDSNQDL